MSSQLDLADCDLVTFPLFNLCTPYCQTTRLDSMHFSHNVLLPYDWHFHTPCPLSGIPCQVMLSWPVPFSTSGKVAKSLEHKLQILYTRKRYSY